MSVLGPMLIVVGTVSAMELVAYSVHRWVMHGRIGWNWHKSHHEGTEGLLEKNDLYGLLFAALALALFVVGSAWVEWLWWVGVGGTLYGFLYFVMHDGLVHNRWPFRFVPKRGYLRRVYQAHRLHHAVEDREGCVSFGFLYAPPIARLKAQMRRKAPGLRAAPQRRDTSR